MARAPGPIKVPPRAYKPNQSDKFSPVPKYVKSNPAIILDGRGLAGKILAAQVAPAIVAAERTAKIWGVNNRFRVLRRQGYFQEKFAVLVDGSFNRPIGNVKFLGSIVIQEEPEKGVLVEAAVMALNVMVQTALTFRKNTPPYVYANEFRIMLDADKGGGREVSVSQLINLRDEAGSSFRTITIYNAVPYAGKIERWRKPNGVVRLAWKKVTSIARFKQIGIQYHYLDSGHRTRSSTAHVRGQGRVQHTIAEPGRPVMVPAITIGMAGEVLTKAVQIGSTVASRAAKKG